MSEKKLPQEHPLWNPIVNPESYSDKQLYQSHILAQYQLCIEMADRISQRRNLANTFFLTLHTLLISAVGFTLKVFEPFKQELGAEKWAVAVPLAAVLALCYYWWKLVRSYRQLNTAKFKVVGEFEAKLPARPFGEAEWKMLGEGKDPKLYTPLTQVENRIPLVFALIYVTGAAWFLFVV